MRSLVLVLLAVVTLVLPSPGEAQRAPLSWVRLAAVDANQPHGSAVFDVTAAPGQWKAVRIEVKGGDLTIKGIEIRYAGGARYTEARNIPLLEGERTRPLDSGPDRFIDGVTVSYMRDAATEGAARLELWGLQSPGGSAATRDAAGSYPPIAEAEPASREVMIGLQRKVGRTGASVFEIGETGRFSRLRIKAHDDEIHVERAIVLYGDGETKTVELAARVAKDAKSTWIVVDPDRFIRQVEVRYGPRRNSGGEARVELVGELAAGWLGPRGPGRDFNGGWVLLGAQTAGFVGFDRDLIPVGVNEGGFRSLRVIVRDRAVTLNELTVVYVTGGVQTIRLARRVDAGQTLGPIALDPDRPIREIRARYRSRYLDRRATGWRPAIVEVWGQH